MVVLQFIGQRIFFRFLQLSLLALAVRLASSAGLLSLVLAACFLLASLVAGGHLYLLSQSVLHACSHGAFSSSQLWNERLGHVLAAENFVGFEFYRALHMLHHLATQSPEDPEQVRHDDTRLRYIITFYARPVAFAGRASENPRIPAKLRATLAHFVSPGVSSLNFLRAYPTAAPVLACIAAGAAIGAWLFGAWGWCLIFLIWIVPVAIGIAFLSWLSYESHRGLRSRGNFQPYLGQDSRDVQGGIIFKSLDWASFSLWSHHVEHHLHPRRALWIAGKAIR